MTDFQVGDRVSVTGVVTDTYSDAVLFQDDASGKGGWYFPKASLTLVERPRRKLRVGSVWECNGAQRYVYLGGDVFSGWSPRDAPVERDRITIDETPEYWREVPVEELEREAQTVVIES